MYSTSDDPRRRAPRHKTRQLSCELGSVLDLSSTGMRVALEGKVPFQAGDSRPVKIRSMEGTLALVARVVWVKRKGWRKHEAALDFINVKPAMAKALESLARFGFIGAGSGSKRTGGRKSKPKANIHVSMDLPDHYATLGLEPGATEEQVRLAYRALARKLHPDVNQAEDAKAQFIAVQESYETLRDPTLRKAYDMQTAA